MNIKIVVFVALMCIACYECNVCREKSYKNCGVNEFYNICASKCEPTCAVPKPFCSKQCDGARCQCAEGYVRNRYNRCVSPCECGCE